MGGVVECFLEGGEEVRSPSVQCRVDPLGQISIVSTHDQVLGGTSGQIFLGSTFPADAEYSRDIRRPGGGGGSAQTTGRVGPFRDRLPLDKTRGQLGACAIEINLSKCGTTHPYLMLQFLTDGTYDSENGLYCTPTGQPCYYYASDNLRSPAYKGLIPEDLVDISVDFGLHFDGASQQGVVFHLIGVLPSTASSAPCASEALARAPRSSTATRSRSSTVRRACNARITSSPTSPSKARQDAGRQEDGAR
jgi:hypothetical protein